MERFAVEHQGVNIPSEPFYLLINLAVGGNWPGAPGEKTEIPAYYLVDYIRVFTNETYMLVAAEPTPTPTGGSNILHVAQIVSYDDAGNPVDTYAPGQITWKVQVVNQDGRPVHGESVTTIFENEDGSFGERVFAWDKTDRHGWAAFTISIDEPGTHSIRVDKISTLSEYNAEADAEPVEITIR